MSYLNLKNQKRIAVLLSTYNGEQYLVEQLNSLLEQTSKDFHVYIRDDGSKDNSLAICKEFCNLYPKIFSIIDENRENIGVVNSFSLLASFIDSELYMFCDQDDIWLPDKIKDIANAYSELDSEKPILLYSDLIPFKGKEIISNSFLGKIRANNNTCFDDLLFRAYVWGCTTLFNKPLRDLAFPSPDGIRYHDSWLWQNAFLAGHVKYFDKRDIYYRLHDNNHSDPFAIINKDKGISLKIKNLVYGNEPQVKKLISRINQLMLAIENTKSTEKYGKFIEAMNGSKWDRIRYFLINNALDKKTILLSPTIFRAVLSFDRKNK